MKVKKTILCPIVGWACLQTVVTLAATPAASVATDIDVLIDTRLNFVVRSAAPGTKIDTLTSGGTLIMVH